MVWPYIFRVWVLILLFMMRPSAALCDTVPTPNAPSATLVSPKPETDQEKLLRLTGPMRQVQIPDARIKIAQLLFQVKMGLPAETFYKRLGKMDLPKEARFLLMEVKKDLGNVLGPEGLRYFLGEPTSGGGTSVEKILLTWRRQMVKEGIRRVMQEFKGRNRIDGYEFKVYYAGIGGWAKETPDQMRFEGDIDFSFICGSRMLAWQMKLAFDSYVKARLGLTGQQADTVCTAHGMAEPEVYVGRHGEIFAVRAMSAEDAKKLLEIDLEKDRFGGEIEGPEVLTRITLDARKMGRVQELPGSKAPTAPGISMEMVRHFLHDIMPNPVYTDIDSFQKAAKYTFRSNDAIAKAFGLASSDSELAGFVKTLLDLKSKGSAAQADAIKGFFGGKMPWGTRLGPVQGGKSRVTLFANKTLLDSFWSRCRDAMWKNAEAGFKTTLDSLRSRAGKVAGPSDAAELKAEMDAVLKMMEIEFLLFDDSHVGGEVPASVKGLMNNFRSFHKGFMKKWGFKILTRPEMEEYRFLEALLKQGGEWNIKTSVAALVRTGGESVMRVNSYLDIPDDKTLGHLRGETTDFNKYMRNTWKQVLQAEWSRQGRGGPPPAGLRLEQVDPKSIRAEIETWMTNKLHGNCVARKIRNVNMILGESIKSSAAGRATMTGMIAVNLAQEIPAYIRAYNEGGWKSLGLEFIRRRVPFGSVTEHAVMGRYGMAAWDAMVTFVPPLALFQVAGMVGAGVADQSWRIFWSSELEYFVNELYEKSEFVKIEEVTMVRYLETYLEIIEARKEAEDEFALGFVHDRGLRLITGPYFLKGKADQDKTDHRRWRYLPWMTKGEVRAELEAIKGKYVSPSALKEDGFDQQILNIVSRHHVWREAWRHANSVGLENHPEALKEIEAEFSEEDYKYHSNPAVARSKFHKERRDKLVEEFEEYYKTKGEETPPQPEADCREELEKARRLSGQLSDLAAAEAELARLSEQLARIREEFDSLPDLYREDIAPEDENAEQPVFDCPAQYLRLKEYLKSRLTDQENRLGRAMDRLKEKTAAIPLEDLLDRLGRAEAGEQGDQVREMIRGCRFRDAATLIEGLPAGPDRSDLEAALAEARDSVEKIRTLYAEAEAAYRTCEFGKAAEKIKEALGLAVCDKHTQSLVGSLAKAEAAAKNEALAEGLLDGARIDLGNCRVDAAAAKLGQAQGKTRCDSLRDRIRSLRTELAQAQGFERPRQQRTGQRPIDLCGREGPLPGDQGPDRERPGRAGGDSSRAGTRGGRGGTLLCHRGTLPALPYGYPRAEKGSGRGGSGHPGQNQTGE